MKQGFFLFLSFMIIVLITGCGGKQYQRAFMLVDDTGLEYENTISEAGAGTLSEESTVLEYQKLAALNNPGLRADFEVWKASIEQIIQKQTLPDPRFTYTYFIEHLETRTGPQTYRLAISQAFPWFGKLQLRGETAFLNSEIRRMKFESEKRSLYYKVETSYIELYRLNENRKIIKENMELLKYLETVAQTGYSAGRIPYSSVIRAQMEIGKMENRIQSLEEMISATKSEMKSLLGISRDMDIPVPSSLPETEPLQTGPAGEFQASHNPDVLALDFKIKKAEKQIDLARKEFYPDFALGFMYMNTEDSFMDNVKGSGSDPYAVTFSLDLPLWRWKYRAMEREKKSEHAATGQKRQNLVNQLNARIDKILFQYRDAERKINLFRDNLIPKSRETLEVTRQSFSAGDAGFTEVIDIQRNLLEFEQILIDSMAKRAARIAEYNMIAGDSDLQNE